MSTFDEKAGHDGHDISQATSSQSLRDDMIEEKGIEANHRRADSDSTGDTMQEDFLGKKAEREITNLARQLTRQQSRGTDKIERVGTRYSIAENAINPFNDMKKDSSIDPESPNFNARAWVKNLVSLQSRDAERYPKRTAGFSFKNLSVHGFGTPTDYQKDVFNITFELASAVRSVFGGGKNKIQILRNFDGLVKDGEMLVVLGRPGR